MLMLTDVTLVGTELYLLQIRKFASRIRILQKFRKKIESEIRSHSTNFPEYD